MGYSNRITCDSATDVLNSQAAFPPHEFNLQISPDVRPTGAQCDDSIRWDYGGLLWLSFQRRKSRMGKCPPAEEAEKFMSAQPPPPPLSLSKREKG